MGSLGAGSPERGYGRRRRIWHVPRANAEKPPNAVPASGGRRPGRAETLANGSPGPWRPPPQEDDPGRCEAQLDPLGALPALLPARVVPDFGVEPDAWAFRLEHPFVGRVLLRVVQRRAASAAVDGVARAKRLHRRRACSEGAGDPLVAPVLVDPTADVVYELPERNPLIYSHAPHRPLFLAPDSRAARCRLSSGTREQGTAAARCRTIYTLSRDCLHNKWGW